MPNTYPETLGRVPLASQITEFLVREIKTVKLPDAIPDSLYRFYRDSLGFRITRVEDRVSVASLPDWAPDFLRDSHPGPWRFIERLARDQDGEPAEYSRTWFHPEQVRFVSR